MRVLGIESSCDETACAIVEDGRKILSNVVATQSPFHQIYKGVVPEIASRKHAEWILPVVKEALNEASLSLDKIDAVAATNRPGLMGSLMVGLTFGKTLAWSINKPFIAVNHILAHLYASHLENDIPYPYIGLLVSGGHSIISKVNGFDDLEILGTTIDDSVGEAFDKVARVMGMPYPGGAAMDRLAYEGKAILPFPSAAIRDDSLDFSFSGIKTAVLNYINSTSQKGEALNCADVAASFCRAAVSSVSTKLSLAIDRNPDIKAVALAGGVAANSHLRDEIEKLCKSRGLEFFCPDKKYCGDNAVMIAAAGYFEYIKGDIAPLSLNAEAARFEDV